MDIAEAIRQRRSIRHYLPDPIPVTVLREILSLASMAPSIGNRQMWRYIVVTDSGLRAMLARLVEHRIDEIASWPEFDANPQRIRAWRDNSMHFAKAPVSIFIVNQGYRTPIDASLVGHGMKAAEVSQLFSRPDIQSVSGMMAYLSLLAEERGYGTCWMTDILIARKDLESSLNLKPGEELTALMTLGKPAEHPIQKSRKAIDGLIEWH